MMKMRTRNPAAGSDNGSAFHIDTDEIKYIVAQIIINPPKDVDNCNKLRTKTGSWNGSAVFIWSVMRSSLLEKYKQISPNLRREKNASRFVVSREPDIIFRPQLLPLHHRWRRHRGGA